jgi:serine/threonine-protein kinase
VPLVALAPPGGSNDLDRYELLFRFAAGGMAEVFVARQRGEGGFLRPVAIKRMLPALAEEPKFVEMFLDEARLAAHVTSPYVVSTLDCGKDEEGSPYIVMELVVGVSLSQALRAAAEKRKHVPPPVIAEILAQTAIGLYDAHHARTPTGQELRIVHRDVSPQNVLLGVDGRARLTDFGVARALERVTRTATGEVKGKLSYFSPEQARMEPLDQRSDIFALGIVAWEALALERLFSRESPMAALTAILHERIADPREHNPDIPEKLAKAVMRALERDLDKRPAHARVFAEELRAAVGTPANATTIGTWVEESGGPRLDTFRKRIETSFRARPQSVSDPAVAENERSASSASNAASFSSNPESRLVGSLGTLPDRAPDDTGSSTDVRAGRTPVSDASAQSAASGVVSLVSSTRVATSPTLDAASIPIDIELAPVTPRRPRWLLVGGAVTGLAAIGIGTAAFVFGATPAPDPTSTTRTTISPPPATTSVEVAVPMGTDPLPIAAEPPHELTATEATETQGTRPDRTRSPREGRTVETPPEQPAREDTPQEETPRVLREETPREDSPPIARDETPREETPTRPPETSTSTETTTDTPGRLRVGTGASRLRGGGP